MDSKLAAQFDYFLAQGEARAFQNLFKSRSFNAHERLGLLLQCIHAHQGELTDFMMRYSSISEAQLIKAFVNSLDSRIPQDYLPVFQSIADSALMPQLNANVFYNVFKHQDDNFVPWLMQHFPLSVQKHFFSIAEAAIKSERLQCVETMLEQALPPKMIFYMALCC